MRIRRHAAALVALTVGALAPQAAYAQRAEGSFQRTVTVSGSTDVDVVSGSGSIEVRQGAAGRVEISGRITANDSWGWRRSQLSAEERVRRLEANPPAQLYGAPPARLVAILRLIDSGEHQDVVIVHHQREPVYLLPELADRNWDWVHLEGEPGEVRLLLTQRAR